ncbi:Abi family protein [Bifidobacterium sp. ESL0790]|uniref:Abi family protein n=1 Tax=Bifidobacterium sp. ESL0790 TaxID=2983233 RepID=UPI0023F95A74|nr:Abi family protein [Bifidobacterium sp. ESL0790]WEV71992.1 Abi family protein [Bifidobacterium sp. ESL0790]
MKEAKTVDQMVDLLVNERQLEVRDTETLRRILLDCNYYRLSGYFRCFQINPEQGNDIFRPGTTVKDFMVPYLKDEQLRARILQGTSVVEQTLRAHLAYSLAIHGDAYSYLDRRVYRNKTYRNGKEIRLSLIENINKWVGKSSESSIHHFLQGNEVVPIWALVEILPFDTVSKIFSLHNNTHAIDAVCSSMRLGKNRSRAAGIIHGMVYLRNLCSHHCRLWNRKMTIEPPLLKSLKQQYSQFNYDSESVWISLITLAYLVDGIKENQDYSNSLLKFVEPDSSYASGLMHSKY